MEPFRAFGRLRGMWRSFLLGIVLAGVLAGCSLGGGTGARPVGATTGDSTSVPPHPTASSGVPAGLDPATRRRLLAEWRVAVKTGGSAGPGSLVFLSPSQLVPILNRVNASIPATTSLNATMSLDHRVVFVLSDSTARRLDIATAARNGRYVHLIAVGSRPPRFKFAAL